MKDLELARRVIFFCDFSADELYNLARNLCGDDKDALLMSVNAFAKAFIKTSSKEKINDVTMFRFFSTRFLYGEGLKRIKKNRRTKPMNHPEMFNGRIDIPDKLDLLSYHERFILLLFCHQKLRIENISKILILPQFLVKKRLHAAAKKIAK